MLSFAVVHRRALHRIPELDNQLPETVQLVQRILAPLPCRVFSPITGSVCAWFDAGKSDAVAFRAELDALPVTEATDLPYASVHPGRMHACCHDAHTAMVLTLAAFFAGCEILGVAIAWYMVAGAVVIGFFVAFAAMFGFDKLKQTLEQITNLGTK